MVRQVSSRSFLSKQRLKHQKLKVQDAWTKKQVAKKVQEKVSLLVVLFWCVFVLICNMLWFYFIGGLLYWLLCFLTSLWWNRDRRPCVLSTQPTVPSFLPAPPVTYGWPQVISRFPGGGRPIWRDVCFGVGGKNNGWFLWVEFASRNANSQLVQSEFQISVYGSKYVEFECWNLNLLKEAELPKKSWDAFVMDLMVNTSLPVMVPAMPFGYPQFECRATGGFVIKWKIIVQWRSN